LKVNNSHYILLSHKIYIQKNFGRANAFVNYTIGLKAKYYYLNKKYLRLSVNKYKY